MKKVMLFLIVLSLTFGCTDKGERINYEALYDFAAPSVVQVYSIGLFPGSISALEVTGTGFFVDDNGGIVTNFHVVDGAFSVSVRINGGDFYNVEVVEMDQDRDLAFLAIEDMPAYEKMPKSLKLGKSSTLKIGEPVMSIGHPYGLALTIGTGVVSCLTADVPLSIGEDLISTNAAVNPGNSGGPLINAKGEVVGVNVGRVVSGDDLAFAIPVDIVKEFLYEVHNGN